MTDVDGDEATTAAELRALLVTGKRIQVAEGVQVMPDGAFRSSVRCGQPVEAAVVDLDAAFHESYLGWEQPEWIAFPVRSFSASGA